MALSISVTSALMTYLLIYIAFGPYGARLDTVKRRISSVLNTTRKPYIIDEELSKPLSERIIKPLLKELTRKMQKFVPKKQSNNNTKNLQNDKLKKMVRQAGLTISVGEYSVIRFVVIIGLTLLSGIISFFLGFGMRSLLGGFIGAYAGFAIMRFHLTANITSRRKSMERQMPDVLDLLSINVEAGLGFSQALLNVIEHYEGPLIDELAVAYREMSMGRTRREALLLFADRCELNEVKTFAGSIVQAEQLGISIRNVLRTQAAAMRTARRNKVEEKAMKTSVKILIPMVLFIFPVLFIVLMGPAAIKIMNQFKG